MTEQETAPPRNAETRRREATAEFNATLRGRRRVSDRRQQIARRLGWVEEQPEPDDDEPDDDGPVAA